MHDVNVAHMPGVPALVLVSARLFGWLAKLNRQPAVDGGSADKQDSRSASVSPLERRAW